MAPRDRRDRVATGTIAYVLKSFPRLSETFIASEIYRLERQGIALRLFVIKRSNEAVPHATVRSVQAPRVHLPEAAPISQVSAFRWLAAHIGGFAGSLRRQALRHPFRIVKAAAMAGAHAVRARKGAWRLRKSPLKEFLQAVALADAVEAAGDVRHLHAHFCHSATTVAWLASILTGLPLSFTAHAKDLYCGDLNPAGLLERKLGAAAFVVTCTEANRAYLQARTTTPVHCVYHGLDVEFARLASRPIARPAAPVVRVLAVGRMVPKKGLDVLIEACGLLASRGVAFEAVIAGEPGDQEPALRARTRELGLESAIAFTGPLPQGELFREYARATVFCLPCRVLENGDRDGIPNVMAEAMACGLPIVATAVSGIPELVEHGVHGLLVAPDSPSAVADAIAALQAQPELAERLGARAKRRIADVFDGDREVHRLSALLQEVAA
jgi:glycosyltransferase involved in cell wall biosynthesis